MSEEIAGTTPESVNPTALSLALAGASREEADAFLRDQRHHIHEQLKQIHLDLWEKWLGVLLRCATLAVGLAVAGALAIAIWDASQAEGTVVDAFSVPPQLAQAGISGEVIATDLTEQIASISDIAQKNSLANSKVVRQEIAEVKVEIPETGVSLGQAWRYLRLWLGHERHLGGTLRLVGDGQIRLTVALDGQRLASVSGAQAALDKLEQQAAEQVFASVDPVNIVLYLRSTGRDNEAFAAAERRAQTVTDPSDRARAFGLFASMTRSQTGNMPLSLARGQISADANPKMIIGFREMMWAEIFMGHDEQALRLAQRMPTFLEKDQPYAQQGQGLRAIQIEGAFERDLALGDFVQAAAGGGCLRCPLPHQLIFRAEALARAHDAGTSRALTARVLAEPPSPANRVNPRGVYISRLRYFHDIMAENWPAAVASAHAYEAEVKADATLSPKGEALVREIQVTPLLAYALARRGDAAGARAAIEATPNDCYDCIRARGLVASVAGQWNLADGWFARAAALGPSLPSAYADWGQSLLARGQPDAAIAKFKQANEKGPHFADPLEYWGEALMAKNRSHLALAKFAEAEKYAPNWGRLHLKWGEALTYAGKKDEAGKQLARATALDLTPLEKSELTGLRRN